MKKLTVRQFATVKRVAQNVNPLVVKKNKLYAKAQELEAEAKALEEEIEGHEAGIRSLTGGHISEDLVTKVVETTNKVDKDGNPIKVTKYLPTSLVEYNEEENCYYLDEPEELIVPVQVDTPHGSDFDVDSETLNA